MSDLSNPLQVTLPALMRPLRVVLMLTIALSLVGCYGPVTAQTRVHGIRATDSVLMLAAPYKSNRVELPAGYYEYMPGFSTAACISYRAPEPVRKKDLVPFLWTTHQLAWIAIQPDGAAKKRLPRWIVWEHGDSGALGDNFIYEIREK